MALRNGTSSTESRRAQLAVQDGQSEVGIGTGVAVSGEMLGGGQHPVVLEAPNLGGYQPAHCRAGLRRRSEY